jgi:hypothetical protein
MTCAERREVSLALVALPRDDSERASADAHARGCPACARALAEARALLRLVDRHGAPAAPSPAVLRRTADRVVADLRGGGAPRVWAAIATIAGFVLVALLARDRFTDPATLAIATLGAVAAAAGAAMLPLHRWTGVAIALVASALFAAALGERGEPLAMGGMTCLALELMAASLPLATTAVLVWRRRASAGPLVFSCVAAVGALAGQAGLHITCEARFDAPHLLAFHVGGVALAALAGWLVSLTLRRMRDPSAHG